MRLVGTLTLAVSTACGPLPILDMTHLTSQQVRDSLESHAGFHLVNHGLPEEDRTAIFSYASEFFAQTKDMKTQLHIKHGLDLRWNEAGSESTYGKTDTRETLYVAPSMTCASECVEQFAELQRIAYNVSTKSSSIGTELLRLISDSLGFPTSYLESLFPETPQPVLLTHSHMVPPSLENSTAPSNVGAHSDWGALTLLLLREDSVGLQMRCPSNHEQWIDVPPLPGSIVVTAGDVLDTWTNGRYAASVHRVKHVANNHRYAIPLFLDPKPELVIKNLMDIDATGKQFRERSLFGLSNAFLHLSTVELRGLLS